MEDLTQPPPLISVKGPYDHIPGYYVGDGSVALKVLVESESLPHKTCVVFSDTHLFPNNDIGYEDLAGAWSMFRSEPGIIKLLGEPPYPYRSAGVSPDQRNVYRTLYPTFSMYLTILATKASPNKPAYLSILSSSKPPYFIRRNVEEESPASMFSIVGIRGLQGEALQMVLDSQRQNIAEVGRQTGIDMEGKVVFVFHY